MYISCIAILTHCYSYQDRYDTKSKFIDHILIVFDRKILTDTLGKYCILEQSGTRCATQVAGGILAAPMLDASAVAPATADRSSGLKRSPVLKGREKSPLTIPPYAIWRLGHAGLIESWGLLSPCQLLSNATRGCTWRPATTCCAQCTWRIPLALLL